MRRLFLTCGLVSSLVYAAANIVVPLAYQKYQVLDQTVSELSAIDSPTRDLWLAFMVAYTALLLAFAFGIWLSAGSSRPLRAAAILGFAYPALGLLWPPMHMRGEAFTTTDTLHIVWTAVTVPLMMFQIAFGAAAFGRAFRLYSVATIAAMLGFGIMTGIQAPNIVSNEPTPLIGLWERIGIGAQTLWIAVFALRLIQANKGLSRREYL